jgi:hypothetical protein
MYRKELNERSPLRVFEQSIHGGLGPGNIGVALGRHGVGKTPFLVGVALDDLMRGRKVLHVALDQSVEKVRGYYDEIFADLARSSGLEDAGVERLEMERNRNIHTYIGGSFSIDRLREAIAFLREHAHFVPRAIMIDGYDFEHATTEGLAGLRGIGQDLEAEIWMTAVRHREAPVDAKGMPETLARLQSQLTVIVSLHHEGKAVHVRLLKDHDNPTVSETPVALDPTTMLLVRE